MFGIDWVVGGGFAAGAMAGAAARYGRLCTMSAIEDAIVGRDSRALKAWGLALAVAIAATQGGVALGAIDLAGSVYLAGRLHPIAAVAGGLVFGLGMTLVGTCGFGLLVRAGGGDLRAATAALVVGMAAMAATVGVLAPLREWIVSFGAVTLDAHGDATLAGLVSRIAGRPAGLAAALAVACVLALLCVTDRRLWLRPRLIGSAVLLGLSIAFGWWTTTNAVQLLTLDRPESLSFVAPVGRALLQLMIEPFRNIGFGVAAVVGVVAASAGVAIWRGDVRWEAFDDAVEMRRHLLGGVLMGFGGVMAQGCTIGQGLSAASTLAFSAPLFFAGVIVGAKLGFWHLLDGRSLWRADRS
jgi:uncharacterized membrane protein YedE/YeeE